MGRTLSDWVSLSQNYSSHIGLSGLKEGITRNNERQRKHMKSATNYCRKRARHYVTVTLVFHLIE